jgi:hypothetical protein
MTRTPEWLDFDVHGRVGLRVAADSPTAAQMETMLACFRTANGVPADVIVTGPLESTQEAAELDDELAYSDNAVTFLREHVQVVREQRAYRIHGRGELLTALVPILDRAMVERGAAMIHAATVAYRGHGVALPAAGGTGKTSTVAKLTRLGDYAFMGDDWAFLTDDRTLLGYAKPMFIKPHHRAIYPHLFRGSRKPLVPSALTGPVHRVTTGVHPFVIRYPRLADLARRWSPEHRMVTPDVALPGVPVARSAPLLAVVYVERYGGDVVRLRHRDEEWMVDRMIGNFHIEMAGFSQEMVTAMAATSFLPWRRHVEDKRRVLCEAVAGVPCHLLQVPTAWSADRASDEVVAVLDDLVPSLLPVHGRRA